MITTEIICKEYDEGKSTYEIAEKYHTYPNKVRRLLKKAGKVIRSKGEAQANALREGRHKHPTKGQQRSESVKEKISKSMETNWKNMSDKDKKKKSELAKEQWENKTLEEKTIFRQKAAKAICKASKEGSKLEKGLTFNLRKNGYVVEFHKEALVVQENLQVDLYLPELKTVIEIDGPTHFLPIWGEDNLARHQRADAKKSGLLLTGGFVLIRVKNLCKVTSRVHERNLSELVLSELKKIEKKFPSTGKRLIELEIR